MLALKFAIAVVGPGADLVFRSLSRLLRRSELYGVTGFRGLDVLVRLEKRGHDLTRRDGISSTTRRSRLGLKVGGDAVRGSRIALPDTGVGILEADFVGVAGIAVR